MAAKEKVKPRKTPRKRVQKAKGGSHVSGSPSGLRIEGEETPGRPPVMTEDGRRALIEAVLNGATREDSARAAGMAASSLYRYMADGRKERIEALKLDRDATPPPGSRWEFLEIVKDAEASFRIECLENIRLAGRGPKGSWQATAWLLERKFPAMFGRVSRVDVAGSSEKSPGGKGAPIAVQAGGVVVLPPLDPE